MPRTLVIDTATSACSVALLDDDLLIAERHDVVGRGHAERLMPMIATLPEGGRADFILVDCGPGSFTGVRVGLAAARALALGWKAGLHGYSSMALIAAAADPNQPTIAVALIGGHGELFVQRFRTAPIGEVSALASLTPLDAAASILDPHVFGSGAAQLVAARGYGHAYDRLPRAAEALSLPAALAQLAPSPIYGRGADAKPAA